MKTLSHKNPRPFADSPPRRFARAFSLIEVLLAIFILGIGMIMVASVFPVGANWTRQATEESTAQTIVQNALAVVRTHYGPNGDLKQYIDPRFLAPNGAPIGNNFILRGSAPFAIQAFPAFLSIPASERSYQFGSNTPFPAPNPKACTYFWTALVRLDPIHQTPVLNPPTNNIILAPSYKYDVYILVFRKGAIEQTFSAYSGEINGLRSHSPPNLELYMPSLARSFWKPGTVNLNDTPTVSGAVPAIGGYGIDQGSGTVFRQVVSAAGVAQPRPAISNQALAGTQPIIFSPPADNTGNNDHPGPSPLIYIYQTTLSF